MSIHTTIKQEEEEEEEEYVEECGPKKSRAEERRAEWL